MVMQKIGFFLLLVSPIWLSSCVFVGGNRVKGNGNITTKSIDQKDFTSIEVKNNMAVYLKNSVNYSIKIETDDNILNYIHVQKNNNGTLEIESKSHNHLDPSEAIKVFIEMPYVKKISLSGVSQLETEGKYSQDKEIKIEVSGASTANISLKAPKIDLEANGASTLTIDGECKDIKANAVGASTINAFGLLAENADARATGASTTRVFSSISLKADASGASTIKYKGNPKVVSDASGASSVSQEK